MTDLLIAHRNMRGNARVALLADAAPNWAKGYPSDVQSAALLPGEIERVKIDDVRKLLNATPGLSVGAALDAIRVKEGAK